MLKCWQLHLSPEYISLWIAKILFPCPPPLLDFKIIQNSLLNMPTKLVSKVAALTQHSENLDSKQLPRNKLQDKQE